MKFAVCEDNVSDRERLCRQLQSSMDANGIKAELCVFDTAEALMKAADKTFFSAFFLDILLPGEMSGMDAAVKLRRVGNFSPIVFVTVTKDYLAQSYSVWAAHYLLKPVADKDVNEALLRALKVLAREEKNLEIMVSRHNEYIPYSEIYYIEGNNRTCVVHTTTGTHQPYTSVQGMMDALDDPRFYYSHRSYIVNLDHVIAVQRDKVAMRDDALLPIRRGETEKLRRAYEDRRFELVSGRD